MDDNRQLADYDFRMNKLRLPLHVCIIDISDYSTSYTRTEIKANVLHIYRTLTIGRSFIESE